MEKDRPLTRRAAIAAPFLALASKAEQRIEGSFVNEALPLGHKLRDHGLTARPRQTRRVPVVIVGGGIAGLSAAWHLDKRGFHDFVVLEMEAQPGGNSRWGENEISRYPWAAHYLPVPSKESTLVRELCEELGLLKNGHWDERSLCFSPQERLFLHGRWQEGLEPELGATKRDRDQYRRFDQLMKDFEHTGQFTIPMETGACPSPLDQETMRQWLERNGFDSPYLRWYVNYACRDDYGSTIESTSAWAGIHYFASRQPDDKGPLTWPEGNGWILERLRAKLQHYIVTSAPVFRIESARPLRVLTPAVEYTAERVIFAAPTFTAPYIVEGAQKPSTVYSPWLTANLTLHRMPRESGVEPAWDNVIYDSPALGYVVATHMTTRSRIDRTVWTFYWSLAEGSPAERRQELLTRDWNSWKEAILHDLERAHPDIRQCVSRIDMMRFGHAMARPVPGFLTAPDRLKLGASKGPVYYANSDLSGFGIFEEAQYRGVKAATAALRGI